jgi:hypothetical protein
MNIMNNKSYINRRAFLASAMAAGLGARLRPAKAEEKVFLNNGLTPWNENPDIQCSLAVADPSRIRLLQLTDIHFFCQTHRPEKDVQTTDDLKRYVDHFEPNVLLVTGDLWHDNPESRGAEFMAFAIEQLEALGVPWLFTWGNHDQLDDYTTGHAALTRAKNSLYRGGPGGGCYSVALTGKDGAPQWDLICLNSMDDGLKAPQRAWLTAEQARRQEKPGAKHAFGVFHIPVKQYDDIWTKGVASGVKFEDVCSWGEDGTSLDNLKALGVVRACFVGHDHINDYSGMMDGIELVYGRATGHGGYGDVKVPKGAKLITANAETGQYTWQSVYPDGRTWVPSPNTRIDTYSDDLWAS